MTGGDSKRQAFRHTNLFDLPLTPGGSHGGKGTHLWASVASPEQVEGALHFIMYGHSHEPLGAPREVEESAKRQDGQEDTMLGEDR